MITTAQQIRDFLDWTVETGRGQYALRVDPQDLCWGCPTMDMGHVAVIAAMVPDTVQDAIDERTKEIFIGARVVERKTQ